jgi:periplasmic protein CpxP/Spy
VTLRIALITGLAAGLVATTAVPSMASAQTTAAPQSAQSRAAERAAEREKERQERIQRRATKLRQALQLRPDQEGALMAYMAALFPVRRDDDDGPSTRNMATPQKLDVEYSRRVQRLNEWRREAEATKSFYNTLSGPQRAAADTMDLLDD